MIKRLDDSDEPNHILKEKGKMPTISPRYFLLLLLSLLVSNAALALEVPEFSGRINDHAQLLSLPAKKHIEAKLMKLEEAGAAQVALLTLPSLEGDILEDYTLRVARTWALGEKGVNNGVLLFVARDDHKIRIEVGYGLVKRLTNADCKHIIDQLMAPRFRQDDFAGGIEAAVDAISGKIPAAAEKGRPKTSRDRSRSKINPMLFNLIAGLALLAVVYITLVLMNAYILCLFLYVIFIPFFSFLLVGKNISLITLFIWLSCPPIVFFWLSPKKWRAEFNRRLRNAKSRSRSASRSAAERASGYGDGIGGGGNEGGGSGGGDSGGFGGDGASGSW